MCSTKRIPLHCIFGLTIESGLRLHEYNVPFAEQALTKSQMSSDETIRVGFQIPHDRTVYYQPGSHYQPDFSYDNNSYSVGTLTVESECFTVFVAGVITAEVSICLDAGVLESQQLTLCGCMVNLAQRQRFKCQLTIDLNRFNENRGVSEILLMIHNELNLPSHLKVLLCDIHRASDMAEGRPIKLLITNA